MVTRKSQFQQPYNERVLSAVTWEIIFQLMRRYQQQYDLRVWETHPCDGQYDCLSLYSCNESNKNFHILDFNLQAQSLHIWVRSPHDERLDIVDEFLRCSDPKELLSKISSMAELPQVKHLPPSNGPVLACGLIATIFKIYIFSRIELKMLMGYCDSSSCFASGLRYELLNKFNITRELVSSITNDVDSMLFYKYFFITSNMGKKIICLIDMSGRIIYLDNSVNNLSQLYDKHCRNINAMTMEVLKKLDI